MATKHNEFTEKLRARNLITDSQTASIKEYEALDIFSLHNELRFFLYLAVLLFTSGIGTLIYKNIDSIGHIAVLSLILMLTGVGFYFSFKKAKGFHKNEVLFDNPIYDYVVLLSTILSCVFIGYLQFQYNVFGNGLSSLVCSLVGFSCAYYFDNKSALSIGITGLATFIGISVTPKTLLENEIYSNPSLTYYGIALGGLLVLWLEYSRRISLKKHFEFVYLNFALHLICICSIAALLETYWYIFVFLFAASLYYFYKASYEIGSAFLFVFTLLYGYIGFNIILFKFFDFVDFSGFWELITILAPIYFISSIFGFIKLIKHFNKERS
ncbi:MAG TPA: DUF2157 domain-containing protein [Flavobacterium sp.]|uniref:DUF2157 domain-containing protein n=1 Tax=Flavobacterium sp. TaxID=239 RepID=UPI002B7F9E9A|nr:DUF2157 domain-containing protein [Flavobacterium sp.]HNP32023.1 DUF2157 domain-containing protein [Flavobacterium sp.]